MEKKEFEGLSLLNQFINEDREKYMVYKTNKEKGVFIPQSDGIYLLELLDYIGFDINKPGTYLFRELVSEIYGDVLSSSTKMGDYKSMVVLKDLNSEKSKIYMGISDRLGIKEEGFVEYIHDATDNIEKECMDKELRTTLLGLNFRDQKPSMMAYKIAKYYEKVRAEGYVKPLKHGLVKEIIIIKSESI